MIEQNHVMSLKRCCFAHAALESDRSKRVSLHGAESSSTRTIRKTRTRLRRRVVWQAVDSARLTH